MWLSLVAQVSSTNSETLELSALLFDNVDALLAYIDVDEVYRHVNGTYARWFGIETGKLVGMTLKAVVGEQAYELIRPHFQSACAGKPSLYETDLFEGGRRKFCQGNYTPHLSHDGTILGVFVVVTDITHRYDAERALRQSEQKFQTAFDYAIIGMALLGSHGQVIQVNRSLCKMLGYTENELLQLTLWEITQSEQHVEAELSMETLLCNTTPVVQVERRYVHKSGALIDVHVSGSLVRTPDGAPLHFVIQVQDISARKADERLKRAFVSTVSHELRTPLTSITGSLGLLASGVFGMLPDKAARLISIAQTNSDRLLRLINDILDIEKIESRSTPLNNAAFDVRTLAQRAIVGLRGYTEQFDVRLSLQDGVSPWVLGNEDRLMQVLNNLLSNAIKFSPPGGTVEIGLSVNDGKAGLSVRDHGPGVPLSFHDRIFSKFAQADLSDTRQSGGTGLGLAIAREIMDQHGGQIWFDSPVGDGAVFHIELPLHSEA